MGLNLVTVTRNTHFPLAKALRIAYCQGEFCRLTCNKGNIEWCMGYLFNMMEFVISLKVSLIKKGHFWRFFFSLLSRDYLESCHHNFDTIYMLHKPNSAYFEINSDFSSKLIMIKKQGSTNLIFVCMDFCAHKMVLRTCLCLQNYVCIKQSLWVLVYII